MHWFWRAAIAVVAGTIYGGSAVGCSAELHQSVSTWIRSQLAGIDLPRGAEEAAGVGVGWFLPTSIIVLAAYAIVTARWGADRSDGGETRCRKCQYILRGITEPRCPECGERI